MADTDEPHTPSRRRGSQRRKLGALGEQLAVEHLRRLDFVIVERNVRTRHGEIDLIAIDSKGTLVFTEVKTRRATNRRRGLCPEEQPLAWLKASQQRRLRRLARSWLYETTARRPRTHTIRFDAIGVIVDGRDRLLRLDHIEGAW
ncbi:MAG TPA: YraN family protein [Solirubrobacteraceae bacterium]|nr:YraN family protein [Solirubrobacteraceae bacterium]